jgi:hypothetical protein
MPFLWDKNGILPSPCQAQRIVRTRCAGESPVPNGTLPDLYSLKQPPHRSDMACNSRLYRGGNPQGLGDATEIVKTQTAAQIVLQQHKIRTLPRASHRFQV